MYIELIIIFIFLSIKYRVYVTYMYSKNSRWQSLTRVKSEMNGPVSLLLALIVLFVFLLGR